MSIFLIFILSLLAMILLVGRRSWVRYAKNEHVNAHTLPYFGNWFTIDFVALKNSLHKSVGVSMRHILSKITHGIIWILRGAGRKIVRWLDKTAHNLHHSSTQKISDSK